MRRFIYFGMWVLVALGLLMTGCSPASISRIGPGIQPRSTDCEIEVLEEGRKPSRPYRDVGMVSLENCQDYLTLPCREWLRKAPCEIGGQAAYLSDEYHPNSGIGPVTYKVMVAAYVADLRYNLEDDPIYRSRTCRPPCDNGYRCVDGTCKPVLDAGCTGGAGGDAGSDDVASGRCMD